MVTKYQSLIYHHSLFSQNVFGCYMSVRLVCRGCLAPSIHPSENQCVAKHGGMVEIYQRLKYCSIAEGQQPSAKIIDGHCKFFVAIMSLCLVCRRCFSSINLSKQDIRQKINVQRLLFLKFIYSEKATKCCEISTVDLSYIVMVKSMVDIS